MVYFCAVVGCSDYSSEDNKQLFSLPTVTTREGEEKKAEEEGFLSERRQAAWLAADIRTEKSQRATNTLVCARIVSYLTCENVLKTDSLCIRVPFQSRGQI